MRFLRLVTIMMIFMSGVSFGQTQQPPAPTQDKREPAVTNEKIIDLPILKRGFRPKLTLQKALQFAEAYLAKAKINKSAYFLFEARLIQYGGEHDKKESRWFFWWVNDKGTLGDYIELTVSMDGNVTRHPSM